MELQIVKETNASGLEARRTENIFIYNCVTIKLPWMMHVL